MNWLNTVLIFKTILDLGVLFLTVLLMFTVGMELEGQHFREVPLLFVAVALYRRRARASDATEAPSAPEFSP